MAERGYIGHSIPGCRDAAGNAFDTFDLLHAFGYSYNLAGENVSWNSYGSSAVTYATGCDQGGGGCNGSVSGVPSSVAFAERGFMDSSAHRGAILSTSYDHFGCAAWNASNGNHYYSCYFVRGGNGATDTTGPAIGSVSGSGATFAVGATPTFTATATDALSLISDGYAAIDGDRIKSWAEDHAGSSVALSAKAPALSAGGHTFTWWVRDASSMSRTVSFEFTVGGAAAPSAPPTATKPPPTKPPATKPPPTTPPATASPTVATAATPRGTVSPAVSDPNVEPPSNPSPATVAPSSPTMPADASVPATPTGPLPLAGAIGADGGGTGDRDSRLPPVSAPQPVGLAVGDLIPAADSFAALVVVAAIGLLLLGGRAFGGRRRRVSNRWIR
jgi:hypothetical protein